LQAPVRSAQIKIAEVAYPISQNNGSIEVPRASTTKRTPNQELADAINGHARALRELAHAIRLHSASAAISPSTSPIASNLVAANIGNAFLARLTLPQLSPSEIFQDIEQALNMRLEWKEPLDDMVAGGPGSIGSAVGQINSYSEFSRRNLNLSIAEVSGLPTVEALVAHIDNRLRGLV
jgi:hypothetical protein